MWSSPWSNGCRGSCPPASPPSAAGCCPSGPSRRCSWWCSPSWPRSPPPAYLPRRGQLELQTQVELSVTANATRRWRTTPPPSPQSPQWKQAGKWASCHGDKLWLTCGAVVLHLADKYAESVFRAPADAETQTAIWTFVNSHRVDVFTVVASCKTKHTWSVLFQSFIVGLRNVLFYIIQSIIESMNRKKCKTFD